MDNKQNAKAGFAGAHGSAANMVPVESLRPLIQAIGVLLGCQFELATRDYELKLMHDGFLRALKKVRDESITVSHLIYESTKQQNDKLTDAGPETP